MEAFVEPGHGCLVGAQQVGQSVNNGRGDEGGIAAGDKDSLATANEGRSGVGDTLQGARVREGVADNLDVGNQRGKILIDGGGDHDGVSGPANDG